jgi:hypothetical protein
MGKTILTRRVGLLFVLAIALAALALSASLVTTSARALPTFTTGSGSIPSCESCHPQTGTATAPHDVAAHGGFLATCTNCHSDMSGSTPPAPAKCAVCHGGVSQILKSANHTTLGCGNPTAGCHNAPSPTPTPTPAPVVTPKLTIKSAASVKVKKPITISGTVTPTSLVGSSVKITIQKKSGTKWKTAKTASATVIATGAYSYKYKPSTKGAYRANGTIAAKTSVNTAASSAWKTFKVK